MTLKKRIFKNIVGKENAGTQHFFYTPAKRMSSEVYWNQPVCPSVCPSVCVSVCVQNTTFCQRAGGRIKSHSATAVVSFPTMLSTLSQNLFSFVTNSYLQYIDVYAPFRRNWYILLCKCWQVPLSPSLGLLWMIAGQRLTLVFQIWYCHLPWHTSAEACEKSSRWLWKEKLCYYWCGSEVGGGGDCCFTNRHLV